MRGLRKTSRIKSPAAPRSRVKISRQSKKHPVRPAADRPAPETRRNGGTAKRTPRLVCHPLTVDRWRDFETLFGERGACGGCWCMWWRVARSQFEKQKGAGNKRAMKRVVQSGKVPGILAYHGTEPVGWCSVAPREDYPVLERSRVLGRVDDKAVWSIVCLFVAKPYRRSGVSSQLVSAAADFARRHGAKVVEGYPFDVTGKKSPQPDPFVWTGLLSAYEKVGFTEVARRSPTRPIVRRSTRPASRRQGK